jgi:hypothetical protein
MLIEIRGFNPAEWPMLGCSDSAAGAPRSSAAGGGTWENIGSFLMYFAGAPNGNLRLRFGFPGYAFS